MRNLAYFAGFFDGEGCVVIGKNGSLAIRVINTNLRILNLFQESFRGSVKQRSQIVNKKQYVWSVYGEDAVEFAIRMSPYCIEKHEQLNKAIEWMDERKTYFRSEDREAVVEKYRQQLTEMKFA